MRNRVYPPSMPRLSPADRRRSIVEAALAVAGRKGLGATTVRDVAAEMGTSSGLIHHYFDTMDDVLAAAFERAAAADLEAARRLVAASGQPTERLLAFIGSYAPAQSSHTMQLWLDAWSEAARRPILQAVSRRLNLAWHSLLTDVIAHGIEEGEFHGEDAEAAAWRLLSLLDGLALQVVAHGPILGPGQPGAWAAVAAEAELGLQPGRLVVQGRSNAEVGR